MKNKVMRNQMTVKTISITADSYLRILLIAVSFSRRFLALMLKTDLRSYKIKKKTVYFLIAVKYSMCIWQTNETLWGWVYVKLST